jgi:imidazolonepropionase-like amidohydrolase
MGVLAIRAARGFDGERMLRDGVVVLINEGRIVGVEGLAGAVPDGWPVLDFVDGTVLPGLIDMHVHLCADSEMGALDRIADYSDGELDAVIEGSLRAQLTAGVTTVRDLGDRRWSVLGWRDRQRVGGVGFACPTIVASGPPITSRGGHCWSMGGEVGGRDELVSAVKERAERGVDVIKIMASGGLSTLGTDVLACQFTFDELCLVVEEGHRVGLPVAAHAHGLPAVEQAIDAGVDDIEHCTCATEAGITMSEELLEVLAVRRIAVCLTLGLAEGWAPAPLVSQTEQEAARFVQRTGITPQARRVQVGRMHRAGVRLVSGVDAGIGAFKPHGILPTAIGEMVGGGIPPTDALASATSWAANVCGLADRKGRLRANYDADIVIVDGDPSTDISSLGHVLEVILQGQRVE